MTKKVRALFIALSVIFIGGVFSGAYFSDSVNVSGNSFTVGVWNPTPTPSPSPTASPAAGDVVINELMWMGSVGHTADEWIELRNLTSSPVDLSGWTISKNTGAESLMLTLPEGSIINGSGYYLISNYSDTSASSSLNITPDYVTTSVDLSNEVLQIKIYSGEIDPAKLVDTAGNGGLPLAGINSSTVKQSMSRHLTPNDGTQAESWFTDITNNSTTYWDVEDGNYGTPGGPNV